MITMKTKKQSTPQSFYPLVDGAVGKEAAEAISKLFGLTLAEVTQDSRRSRFVTPRFAIAYVLHRGHGLDSEVVAQIIGRQRCAVSYACTQFQNWVDTVPDSASMLARCEYVASQVFDKLPTGVEQVTPQVHHKITTSVEQVVDRSARNETPNATGCSVKQQNKEEKSTTYAQNTENAPSLYKYIYKNSKGVPKGEAVEYTLPPRLDNPDFFGVWNEWLNHRGDIKKPLTQNMVKAQLKMMAREGAAVSIETMQSSMEQGWTGLFPDKITGGKNNARFKNNKSNNEGFNKGDGSAYEAKARSRGAEDVGEAFSL
jgi:hypothetical protein